VAALGELLDDLGVEGRQVGRLAAGDQAAVGVDLLVDPGPAGVLDVGPDARPRRQGAALDHVGLDQGPGAVADRGHRLAGLEEGAHERDRGGVGAQRVGVGDPAGQHQAVVVVGAGLRDGLVDREGVALVEVVEALDVVGLERQQVGGGTGLLDRLAGLGVFDLLNAVGGQERDRLALQLACHVLSSLLEAAMHHQ
jgi:hypothetical protein